MFKILVIEDDPAIQQGLQELLLREHYSILQAFDGINGIEKALSNKPHLILLDINLPGKNGIDVCRELRSLKFINPIIILSSNSAQVDKVLGLEIGADDYITKPFDSKELIARIRANLRKVKNEGSDELPYEKKLCAIFFSDMYGYSEKMNTDEEAALILLSEHNNILSMTIKKYSGRIIEITGDAFLASFESVSSAVNCACAIQEKLTLRNKSFVKSNEIMIRIGIHLGDVFVFSDHLKGDVLNIASRVQHIALPGTVFITSGVYDIIKNNRNYKFLFMGNQKLKNIEKPVDVYSVVRAYEDKLNF